MYMGEKEEEEDVATWRSHQKVSKSTVSNKGKLKGVKKRKVHLQMLAKANVLYKANYQTRKQHEKTKVFHICILLGHSIQKGLCYKPGGR